MRLYLVVVAGLIVVLANDSEGYSLCQENIINKIKEEWGPNNEKMPTGMIEELKSAGKEVAVATTQNYFVPLMRLHQFSTFICGYANWDGNQHQYDTYIRGISKETNEITDKKIEMKLEEKDGALICNSCPGSPKMYRFFNNEGVIGVYICNQKQAGTAEDNVPDGFIKAKDGQNKEAIGLAKVKAKSVLNVDMFDVKHNCDAEVVK